ncbi:MAG: glycosyltransferase [Patescibacteria group bacterium]
MKYPIANYNRPETILFISSYPEKGVRYSKKVCAVGGFTKNTIEHMGQKRKYVILTVKVGKEKQIYEEDSALVCRIIDRKNPLSFIPFIEFFLRFNRIKNVVVEFEFGSFGTIYNTLVFSLMFLIIRLLNKNLFTVIHQITESLDDINEHLGWAKKSIKTRIYGWGIRFYYTYITVLSNTVVTTEEIFKKRLRSITEVKTEKIKCIPHGVDTQIPIKSKMQSRRKLGLPLNKKIVLFFGYLGWYKGADLFLEYASKCTDDDYYFVIAGGPSFTNGKKAFYRKYLEKFKNLPSNVRLSGFVPEDLISRYYAASDVVILPYRYMMSSSGPLSLAFSMKKPILLSDKLLPYLKSTDFKKTLEKNKLGYEHMFFDLDFHSFMNKLKNIPMKKMKNFSQEMRTKRKYDVTAGKLSALISSYKI